MENKHDKALILWFDEIGIEDVPMVGGKNASRKVKGRETIHRVGDCVAIGNLRTVIWRAWDVCMKI